jgi:hypothetical protein
VLGVGSAIGVRWSLERISSHPTLAVRQVEVVGTERAQPEDVLELAGIVPGDRWLALDREAVCFRVRSHPWVDEVKIRRLWLGKVRLEVAECTPVARLILNGRGYGICEDLRIVPGPVDTDSPLPVLRSAVTDAALTRGLEYVLAIHGCGIGGKERVELDIGDGTDRIRLPGRDFSVSLDEAIAPERAVRNFSAFLESLDGIGASRGTLRLISDGTAVWEAVA